MSANKIGSKPGLILSDTLPRHDSFLWTGLIQRVLRRPAWANSSTLVFAAFFFYELHQYIVATLYKQ